LFRPLPCGRFPARWLAPEGDAMVGSFSCVERR
jgi:hypothetical protein